MNTPDRRMRLRQQNSALTSLRWPGRPDFPEGNTGWTYMVNAGNCSFAVVVGQTEEGQPFECWTLGAEQSRGLGAVAKTLSADMRAMDRDWLNMKLEALAKVTDGLQISLDFGSGELQVATSASAALARVVAHRVRQIDNSSQGETPLVDALFAREEPVAGPDGTLSWTTDVVTGADSFSVFLKEAEMEDGSRRPYAIRLAGNYPAELDGLCALLSIDMRVIDPAWIGMKLRKLLSYVEPSESFFAKIPGQTGSQRYGSTVAYLSQLILHRYTMLGLLTQEGKVIEAEETAAEVIPLALAA